MRICALAVSLSSPLQNNTYRLCLKDEFGAKHDVPSLIDTRLRARRHHEDFKYSIKAHMLEFNYQGETDPKKQKKLEKKFKAEADKALDYAKDNQDVAGKDIGGFRWEEVDRKLGHWGSFKRKLGQH